MEGLLPFLLYATLRKPSGEDAMPELDETLLADVQVTLNWATRRHWKPGDCIRDWPGFSDSLGVYYIERGGLEVAMSGGEWTLTPGSIFLVPPRVVRDRLETTHGAVWTSIGIVPLLHGRLPLAELIPAPGLWDIQGGERERLLHWLDCIIAFWEKGNGDGRSPLAESGRPRGHTGRLIAEGMAKAIFALCWQHFRPGLTQHAATLRAPVWLLDALHRMRSRPESSVSAVCQAVGVSPAHLRRMFHRYIGQSPQAYLSECRLATARSLIETTDDTIAAISAEVGFESLSHFTTLFTQRYQVSPARYRQARRRGFA